MSAGNRLVDTTAALAKQVEYLAALAKLRDTLQVRFEAVLTAVSATHAACIPSDEVAELDDLSAGLDSIEALATAVFAAIDRLLADATNGGNAARRDQKDRRNIGGSGS